MFPDEIQFWDFEKLPDDLKDRISEIILPFYNYFKIELPLEIEEIDKINDENIKLIATVKAHREAEDKLRSYKIEYTTFLDSLNEYHMFSYDDSKEILIKYSYFRKKFTNKDDLHRSIEFKEFYLKEIEYQHLFEKLSDELKKKQVKDKYRKRYNLKKNSYKKPDKIEEVIDIPNDFSRCFDNPKIAQEFIKVLISRKYISESEKWIGLSKNPGELRDAFRALEALDLLKPGLQELSSKKTFYYRFGLSPEGPGIKDSYISERSLRNTDITKDYEKFIKILAPLTRLKF